MSHNDNTPDQSGTGAGGSSSSGRRDVPEYGQRVEGAPSGPSYEPPRSGQGGGDPYSTPQYGQGYQGQDSYGQGQYNQGQYGGQGYQGQYDMNQYGAGPKPAGTGLGIASLVLGIVALLTCWFVLGIVPGLVGLVLGIVALRKLGRTPGASKALPIIGIVLSVLAILASILFLVLFGALFSEFGPAMEACSQYSSDQAAFQQCLERELGFTGQDL
jgi:hypothetical protein